MVVYRFREKEYDMSKHGVLAELLNILEDNKIIRRTVDEVNKKIVITYYNNLWQKIGTSDDIWSVLDTLVEK